MRFFEGETLTLEKFQDMANSLPPRPEWIGYTVNSEMYRRLLSEDRFSSEELEFGRTWTRDVLFEVPNQTGEIVGWSSRDDLNLYLEMMGERATERTARKQALLVIAGHSSLPLSEIAARTIEMPDHHLVAASRMIGPVGNPKKIFEEFAKAIAEKFVESRSSEFLADLKSEPKPVKKRKVQNAPFYAKFLKKEKEISKFL